MLKSLERLRGALGQPAHTYRPSAQTFGDLDIQRLDRELRLAESGSARGERNQPPADATTLDAMELKIVEHVGAAQKLGSDELQAQLATFHERLIDLDFESRFGAIEEIAHSGLADLKAEQQMALDDLHGLRRDLTESESHLTHFRSSNRLRRPATKKSVLGTITKLLIIALIVVLEVVANGYFLSGGNELGLIGGIVEATLFSLLNVGVALFVALVLLPNLYHRNFFRKVFGLVVLVAFLAWAAGLNLGLAHYRETSGTREATITFAEQARDAVMERLQTRPLQLDQFESWLLFAIGILFALIALIDGLSLVDKYPGFQKVTDDTRKARKAYADQRRAKIQDLTDVRQDYQDAIADLRSDIAKRRTEHQSILANRLRMLTLFQEHQTQLEKAANQLLRTYRDANIAKRTAPPPKYFTEAFQLPLLSVQFVSDGEMSGDALKEKIDEAQANLKVVMVVVTAEFDLALARYRELDILTPDAPSGTA